MQPPEREGTVARKHLRLDGTLLFWALVLACVAVAFLILVPIFAGSLYVAPQCFLIAVGSQRRAHGDHRARAVMLTIVVGYKTILRILCVCPSYHYTKYSPILSMCTEYTSHNHIRSTTASTRYSI